MLKFFMPDNAVEVGDAIRLSNGKVVPKWVFVAVPIEGMINQNASNAVRETSNVIVDLISGAIVDNTSISVNQSTGSDYSETYDFSNFSTRVNLDLLNAKIKNLLRTETENALVEGDPGFFASAGGESSIEDSSITYSPDMTPETNITPTYKLSDLLLYKLRVTRLDSQDREIALKNLVWNTVNIISRINAGNPKIAELNSNGDYAFSDRPLDFKIYSGYSATVDSLRIPEYYMGRRIELLFNTTPDQVYQKAIDISLKTNFDKIIVNYSPTGSASIIIIATAGSNLRKLATAYDGIEVYSGKLINASRDTDLSQIKIVDIKTYNDNLLHANPGDSYMGIMNMILQNPNLFGGIANATKLLKDLGFPATRFLSDVNGQISKAASSFSGDISSAADKIKSALKCPENTQTDPSLFPVMSHPAFKQMTDKSQMDETGTQNNTPMNVRANNPLNVKVIKGVTDLKTRFGFLGEAEGIAVYRDHIGGAAAGLNYLMSTMNGSTFGAASKKMFGDQIGKDSTPDLSSLTSLTSAKLFNDVGKHLFGVEDPTGAIQECGMVDSNNRDSTISYAAAMAKTLANHKNSTLTYEEWVSAYQIAKNEPEGHLKKTTTGVDLPAQEKEDTQDTGAKTKDQGAMTTGGVDEDLAKFEKWNPVSNFEHYSQDKWINWINQGLINYEQKNDDNDTTKIGKKPKKPVMKQDPNHPTNYTILT